VKLRYSIRAVVGSASE